MALTTELRLTRAWVALAHQHAKQQQDIVRLATGGTYDKALMAEWRGQEIALSRVLATIDGTIPQGTSGGGHA